MQGFCRLPGATALCVNGRDLRKTTYWTPEIRPHLVPAREEDAFESLRSLLFEVMGHRMRGSHAVGPRCSAEAWILPRCRRSPPDPSEPATVRLIAISAVVPDANRSKYTDERQYIEEFRSWPNVSIQYVTAPGAGPFDRIDDPLRCEDTFVWTSRMFLYDAFSQVARDHGVDLILEGCGGEYGPTVRGAGYIRELAIGLKLPQLVRLLRDAQAVTGVSPVRALARELLGGLSPRRRWRSNLYLARDFRCECEVPANAENTLARSSYISAGGPLRHAAKSMRRLDSFLPPTGRVSRGRYSTIGLSSFALPLPGI